MRHVGILLAFVFVAGCDGPFRTRGTASRWCPATRSRSHHSTSFGAPNTMIMPSARTARARVRDFVSRRRREAARSRSHRSIRTLAPSLRTVGISRSYGGGNSDARPQGSVRPLLVSASGRRQLDAQGCRRVVYGFRTPCPLRRRSQAIEPRRYPCRSDGASDGIKVQYRRAAIKARLRMQRSRAFLVRSTFHRQLRRLWGTAESERLTVSGRSPWCSIFRPRVCHRACQRKHDPGPCPMPLVCLFRLQPPRRPRRRQRRQLAGPSP